ncbi:hypothetical protein [Flavobacterium phragmitis]|uniref:Uncharacterized protein n=1 Tax=Flavobacterium phragmitis TaxID=739143 RepID=A0A1I1KEK9_9FLAO|nr:hypothetical protein [Flavobacterium phragmitis]SFC58965.1 hypothetical protein SAMN05216297_101354 [Flavobacterium phragmitis]
MKNNLLLFILLISSLSNAQKIRWDNLSVRREVQPSLFLKENPLDVGFLYTSTDQDFFADQTMQYYVADTDVLHNNFIANNLGCPKLVALLEYKYQPATLHIIKKDLKYQVAVISHLYANLLLIDPEKGVFDVQEVKLGDADLVNPVGNTKGYNSNLGYLDYPNNLNTTLLLSDLSEFEANQYREQKNLNLPRKTEVKTVDQIQLLKLRIKVGSILQNKFHTHGKYANLAFNYLKEDKDFNGENFNKASQLINTGIDPIDETKVRQALEIWKTEAKTITNLEDKKNKKYYIAIQENILQCYNVLRDFTETDEIANNLKTIDTRNEIADALISNKKRNAVSAEKKEIIYSPIPPRFAKTDLTRFLNKKADRINELMIIQPGKFDVKLNDMHIYKNACILIKENKPGSENFAKLTDLLINITTYADNASNSSLPKEANESVLNFNLFCKKIQEEKKKFDATFDFKKEASSYKIKLTNHLLSLHKIEEFTSFNDVLSVAVDKTIAYTKPENTVLAHDFIDFNMAMTLKQLTNTTKFDNLIKEKMSNITSYLDKKFPVQNKEVFFEYKNICKLIQENKKFSHDEIIYFSNTLNYLYTYC